MPFLPILALLALRDNDRVLVVFAAASLRESFTAIARRYEGSHPGTQIRLNFGGSQLLAAQINHGAPADVFASADERNLRRIKFDPSTYCVFAENRLTVIVRSNYGGNRSLHEIASASRIIVADPSVPVGAYTEQFLLKARSKFGDVWYRTFKSHIVSREQDVRSVLMKVQIGEADAGVVYVSDSFTAGDKVVSTLIPDSLNVIAAYPAAVPLHAPHPSAAKEFVKYLTGPDAQKVLASRGFRAPRVTIPK